MKKLLLLTTALVTATCVSSAHARTDENQLFVCTGELIKDPSGYSINETWSKADYPMECYIDDKVIRRILGVCRVGDVCIVSAKGESGNANRHLIQKVFEVQRSPITVKEEKEMEKEAEKWRSKCP